MTAVQSFSPTPDSSNLLQLPGRVKNCTRRISISMDLLKVGGEDDLMSRRMRRPSMVQMIQTLSGGNMGQGQGQGVAMARIPGRQRDWQKELKLMRFAVWGLVLLVMFLVRYSWWDYRFPQIN